MTKAERDVIDAACRAVNVDRSGRVITADISKDPALLGALIRAVAILQDSKTNDYWRET
jgi:hypothetical protein